jgi:outer membrane lipoprotein carrier protein
MKQFRAEFAQTVVDADQNIVHEAQGVLTMTRPNKLRWETDETLLIADGDAVWNVDAFVDQVTVLSQSKAVEDNPIVLLTATDAETWSKFTIRKVDTTSVEGEAAAQLLSSFQVTPKEIGGQISALTLTFNQNNELAALNMLDAQQQISTFMFDNIETRFPLAADTFTVDIPDSYIVDDQR